MICPACGFESPAGARFCGGCGTTLGSSDRRSRRADLITDGSAGLGSSGTARYSSGTIER